MNTLIKNVDSYYADYEPTKAARAISDFVQENLSNWYVRLCRRRFWKGEYEHDKKCAYQTLYECLETLSKLIAPIAPFFGEKMCQSVSTTIFVLPIVLCICTSASADARGLATACFVDLGAEFLVADATGEPPLTRLVASITQEENGAVFVYFVSLAMRPHFFAIYLGLGGVRVCARKSAVLWCGVVAHVFFTSFAQLHI